MNIAHQAPTAIKNPPSATSASVSCNSHPIVSGNLGNRMGQSPDLRATLWRTIVKGSFPADILLAAALGLFIIATILFVVPSQTRPAACIKPTAMPATWYGKC